MLCGSKFLIHKDLDSEHLYIFDYRFRLPALFGNQENSIKVSVKAKDLWFKKYTQVTFNGEKIHADEYGVFDIVVPSE